jgi:uncharacterized protein HemX
MSKFQSTISTVAALASIFGAGAAGWKLAQSQPDYKPEEPQPAIEQKLTQLEQKLEEKLTIPIQEPPQQAPAATPLPTTPQTPPPPPAPTEQPSEVSP